MSPTSNRPAKQPSMFKRASLNLALTPAERAILRCFQCILITVGMSAVPMFFGVLNHQPIDWTTVQYVATACLAMSLILTLSKYFRAFKDGAPLATTLAQLAQAIAVMVGLPDPTTEPGVQNAPSPVPPTAYSGTTARVAGLGDVPVLSRASAPPVVPARDTETVAPPGSDRGPAPMA